ncbi:MAG: cobalamin-dependent protein [Deltaproteobacteria bacterium]|nr:cobalamin-dependent protein [Deltaproteobacteria bacterium]MBW1922258.1 cobalamin-dependent protein [Deltaproteobacteria bacterium]MBW1949533.1 cobalamin-dependent protein [Deltaproteobacteria bacterium]MBW2008416.1 cobalamin-dependent protein [Deltaproteobacteria bacterium]MBW2102178.1 cobalamin-dependent protein [Deltaproteobacteria bacterium]
MKFLVIAPRYIDRDGQYYEFPLGLGYISAVLKHHGYSVDSLNLNHFPEDDLSDLIQSTIIRKAIDVVCTGGLSTHYQKLRALLELIKSVDRDLVTIVGGGIVCSEPELMQNALGFDIGVVGEGEETIVELAEALTTGRDLHTVQGLVFRNRAGEIVKTKPRPPIMDLDALPYPDYEGLDVGHYLDLQRPNDNYYLYPFDNPRILPIISSRSCPFNCTFCFHPLGNRYRQRSLDSFFEEVEYLVSTYDINMLAILDELFSLQEDRLREFCQRMRKYNLKWLAQMRVDRSSKETLELLKKSGMFYISYGLESASPPVLESMKKHITVEQIESTLAMTRECGIGIQGNFLFGDPAETMDTYKQTLDWWKKHHQYQINLTPIIPYPGCQDYRYCVEKGLIPDRLAFIEAGCPSINMTEMDQETYDAMFQEIFQATYEHRIFGTILAAERERYDPVKGTPLYTLKTECPHCGGRNTYRHFHKDGLEIFKLACRICNQRYDLSSAALDHVGAGVDATRGAILAAVRAGRPVSVTPFLPKHLFYQSMELLGLNWREINLAYVLDYDPRKKGKRFLSKFEVLLRDRKTIQTRCKDHLIIVLPCLRQGVIISHLAKECGVPPENIIPVDLA